MIFVCFHCVFLAFDISMYFELIALIPPCFLLFVTNLRGEMLGIHWGPQITLMGFKVMPFPILFLLMKGTFFASER